MIRLAILITLLLTPPVFAQTEDEFRGRLCENMEQWVYLDKARDYADCISETHAIAMEISHDFRIALGRALTFAAATGLKPGLLLICQNEWTNCTSDRAAAARALANTGLAGTIWHCKSLDPSLAACQVEDFGPPRE